MLGRVAETAIEMDYRDTRYDYHKPRVIVFDRYKRPIDVFNRPPRSSLCFC